MVGPRTTSPHTTSPHTTSPHPGGTGRTTPRSRSRRGEGPKLRAEILGAATRLLIETGDEAAVSVRAVAELAGVSPPSIYLHFADKDELIFECSRALMAQLQDAVLHAVDGIDDPAERLRIAAHTYVRFGMANPEPYRIMFMSPHHQLPAGFDVRDHEGAVAFKVLVGMVAAIRGPAQDPTEAALTAMGVWATFHGITALLIAKADDPIAAAWPDARHLVDHLVDVHLTVLQDHSQDNHSQDEHSQDNDSQDPHSRAQEHDR